MPEHGRAAGAAPGATRAGSPGYDVERARVARAYAARAAPGRYDPARPSVIATAAARARAWEAALAQRVRPARSLVEVGCGTGAVLAWARGAGLAAVGVDLLADRLDAVRAADRGIGLALADGRRLPVASGSVDVVACSTLFSSILDDAVAAAVAGEIDRVLAADGTVLWFDLRRDNPANRDVSGIGRQQLRRWFAGYEVVVAPAVLAPPIARRLERHPGAAAALAAVPVLRTHLAGYLRRMPSPSPRQKPAP